MYQTLAVTAPTIDDPSVEVGYSSINMWRGQNIGPNEAFAAGTGSIVLPADINLSFIADYSNSQSTVDNQGDLSAAISKDFAGFRFSASYIWYTPSFVTNTGGAVQEVGIGVSKTIGPVDLSLTQYIAVEGDNNQYGEVTVDYKNNFGLPFTLDLNSVLGYIAEQGVATYLETTLSTEIDTTYRGIVALPFVAYSISLSNYQGANGYTDNSFVGGISFKRAF
jgi:hypothetical protein